MFGHLIFFLLPSFLPSAVVVSVHHGLRPARPRPPAAGEDAHVGPPEGGVAQRVQHLQDRKISGGPMTKFAIREVGFKSLAAKVF